MASKPEITTTNIETPTTPEESIKEIQDALNISATIKDCPQRIQHRLSLRLSNSPGSSPTNVISSPRSPNRSISPHHILVNKLYEEEILCDELITTNQVDEDIIEAVNKINSSTTTLTSKQLYSPKSYSPNRSPEPNKL